jgi:hypothetical protein
MHFLFMKIIYSILMAYKMWYFYLLFFEYLSCTYLFYECLNCFRLCYLIKYYSVDELRFSMIFNQTCTYILMRRMLNPFLFNNSTCSLLYIDTCSTLDYTFTFIFLWVINNNIINNRRICILWIITSYHKNILYMLSNVY